MNAQALNELKNTLDSRWPIVGAMLRRRAARRLAADKSADAVDLLAAALKDADGQVHDLAAAGLQALTDTAAIDKLCALWAERRDAELGSIIAEKQYVASNPLEVRVLSALHAGRAEIAWESDEAVKLLAGALSDKETEIKTAAGKELRKISKRSVVDKLCHFAMDDPDGALAKICLETRKRPSDPDDLCLFLFVTKQFDDYLKEDYEFQHLHAAYERASAAARGHVMAIYRSGDQRWTGFLGVTRKPLSKCTDQEIEFFLETELRRNNWLRLFQAFIELPLKHGFSLLPQFAASRWKPEGELAALFKSVVAEAGEFTPKTTSDVSSPVFERWLHEGYAKSGIGEAELVKELATAEPQKAVAIVGALALARAHASDRAREVVRQSPHWLVRMAGYASGLLALETGSADSNYWVKELATGQSVLDFWPATATPEDISKLEAMPGEAFTGKLGSARNVLRQLMAYRMTAPVVEDIEVEIAADAAVLEDAD